MSDAKSLRSMAITRTALMETHAMKMLHTLGDGPKAPSPCPPCTTSVHDTHRQQGQRYFIIIIIFLHTSTSQLMGKAVVTGVVPSPPVLAFVFYRAEGSAIPLLVDS